MSGAFGGVPNQFANAVTATGLQLDQNNNTITAYLNDPTNRNNYAAAGGSTNTLNITFAPPVIGGYTAGLELTWKWNQTNSAGVVLNANTLGNVSLVNPDGSALAPGQGVIGSIGKAVYDGTQAIYLGGPIPATQAMMSTATITSGVYATPANAKFSPNTAKAWAQWQGTATGTIAALSSYGVASIVKVGSGSYSVTLSSPFATTSWVPIGGCASVSFRVPIVRSQTASSCVIISHDGANPNDADIFMYFTAYGTLA